MGYAGKLKEKGLAIKLRNRGLSYRDIQKQVKVSKDTLSRWCRDIILSPDQLEKLRQNKLKGAEKGRIIGAKRQQDRRIKETLELLESGKSEVGNLTKRERFLIGIALYAAEGTKVDGQVVFSNSDPKLISFMAKWFKEFCMVQNSKFRGNLWIHENHDELRATKFWSKLTGIPLKQFHKSYIAENKINSKKIRKHIHEFGVFGISFSDSKKHRKIMGWISGITA